MDVPLLNVFFVFFSADRSFDYLFQKWNLQCSQIALSEFVDDVAVVSRDSAGGAAVTSTHEIQMLIITSLL